MGQINYVKRTKVPAGCSTTKMLASVTDASSFPVTSQVLHTGYGGQRGCQMIAVEQSGTVSTIDYTLQGRADPTCPWFDLLNVTALSDATSLGAGTGDIERLGSAQGAFPEMRVVFNTLTGTSTPTVDVWVTVAVSA